MEYVDQFFENALIEKYVLVQNLALHGITPVFLLDFSTRIEKTPQSV